jgi:NTP pyrophosphatase (non-canonical NTP hydrolase)
VADPKSAPVGSLRLADYASEVEATDVLDQAEIQSVLLGLFGEVGEIMSTAKKHLREGEAYPGFRRSAEEEFGDTLWYFAALCRRLKIPLDHIFSEAAQGEDFVRVGVASDQATGAFAHAIVPTDTILLDDELLALGRAVAQLLTSTPNQNDMKNFARHYLRALHGSGLNFSVIARANIAKTRGAFIIPNHATLPDYDSAFASEEQLPRQFRIKVSQRASGKTYLQWNDVFVGDPLTDNIADRDDYRFHDVFHFAYAAILHWSPVVRSLIKQKRKSDKSYDEEQDSGRAIVVEEGVSAWIFARARELNFFENQQRVSYSLLKTVGEFVSGYEVSSCPLKLWERAILDGYAVFRHLRAAKGGWIIGDRRTRSIIFEPLEPVL